MQASFACVGVFVCGAIGLNLQNTSRSEVTKVKIPAQPEPGWTGHPGVYWLLRVLAWATRPVVASQRAMIARGIVADAA